MYVSNEAAGGRNVTTKEISKGIYLHKQQYIKGEDQEIIQILKVEVRIHQVLEFTANFAESENLVLEGRNDLIAKSTIQPFTLETVAILRLLKNWKLKSKFRFVMHTPSIEHQQKYLSKHLTKLKKEISITLELLKGFHSDILPLSMIELQLKRHEICFIDPYFLPIETSLFGNKNSPYKTLIQWRRPIDFMSLSSEERMTIYNAAIDVDEIKEGALGDGWFISVIAALAEVPPLIDRLFVTKEVSKEGVYRVKFVKNGEWVTVTVDDYFPCIPGCDPIFGRSAHNELWLLILEKAYAKLHGSYLTLKGGYAHEALSDLTGCPCMYYNFGDESVKEMINRGILWNRIKDAYERGYLLLGSMPGEERWTDIPTGDTEDNMLLAGHSYAVVRLVEVQGHRLLKIKNLWSQFEW